MECIILMVMAVIVFTIVKLTLMWEERDSQRQLDTFYRALEDGLQQHVQPALKKAKDEGVQLQYNNRSWFISMLRPSENYPYHRVQVMTRELDLPHWCAISLNGAGDFLFVVNKQSFRFDPEQCDYPNVSGLYALRHYSKLINAHRKLFDIYPEYALMTLAVNTAEEASDVVVSMLRDFSAALDTLHINADLGTFWYAVCYQNSPDSEAGQVALSELGAFYIDQAEVPELWLERLEVMADTDTMALVHGASTKAQRLFFEQDLTKTQWLDYAQAGLPLEDSRKLVNKCIDRAYEQMRVEQLDQLSRQHRQVSGLLFLRFWSSTKTARFLIMSQPWWALMPDDQLMDCMAAVIADTPHLVEWWMFESFMNRWTVLERDQQDRVARWFASRTTKSIHWLDPPERLMSLIQMLPHFDRSDAQVIFDAFVEHAVPKEHYAPMYKAINKHFGHPSPPAVALFKQWFESLEDDPRMFGALSVSADSGLAGALTGSQSSDGQLSMTDDEVS